METGLADGIFGLPAGGASSICLWVPELTARKPKLYEASHSCRPGRFGYPFTRLSDGARDDREIISWLWEDSEQEPLPAAPLEVECISYRAPGDDTGDFDHWLTVIADHLTRAGAWPDDKWIQRAVMSRVDAELVDEVGTWLFAWVA